MAKNNPLAFVMGGGRGMRLLPLTRDRAKPAVPFGGNYRIIDFVLTNLYNSGIRKALVLVQYESKSLHDHLRQGWYHKFGMGKESSITTVPPRLGEKASEGWYRGTADALIQNRDYVRGEEPSIVNVFGGDHIYFMDISQKNSFHLEKNADLTISAIPFKREAAANKLGVLVVNDNWQLTDFEEKPSAPTPMPGNSEYCLASMGNYAFNPDVLWKELEKDANKTTTYDKEDIRVNPDKLSSHDFGFDVIPSMLREGKRIFVYNFMNNIVPGQSESERGYWRDIGDLDAYYEASMEVRFPQPLLNLYNREWELSTFVEATQPAKFDGRALESIVANGSIISNSNVERSVISYYVKVDDGAEVLDSILLGQIHVGKGATIKNAIVDRGVRIPDNEVIGVDKTKDRERGFTISPKGITVVPRNYVF